MKRYLIAFVIVTGFMAIAAPSCDVPNAPGKKWQATYVDEFDNAAAFANNWTKSCDWNIGFGCNTYNKGREWYNPDHVSQDVSNGGSVALFATAGVDPYCSPPPGQEWAGNCTYKSGTIQTARPSGISPNSSYKFKQTYGYWEARIKMPSQNGMFAGFWLLPACEPACDGFIDAEYDVTEYLSSPPVNNISWMSLHNPPDRSVFDGVDWSLSTNGACPDAADLGSGYHTYGMDWRPTSIAWYLDGVKCGQANGTTYNQPMYAILNLQADPEPARLGPWGNVGLTSVGVYDAMVVDYVKIYKEVPV